MICPSPSFWGMRERVHQQKATNSPMGSFFFLNVKVHHNSWTHNYLVKAVTVTLKHSPQGAVKAWIESTDISKHECFEKDKMNPAGTRFPHLLWRKLGTRQRRDSMKTLCCHPLRCNSPPTPAAINSPCSYINKDITINTSLISDQSGLYPKLLHNVETWTKLPHWYEWGINFWGLTAPFYQILDFPTVSEHTSTFQIIEHFQVHDATLN